MGVEMARYVDSKRFDFPEWLLQNGIDVRFQRILQFTQSERRSEFFGQWELLIDKRKELTLAEEKIRQSIIDRSNFIESNKISEWKDLNPIEERDKLDFLSEVSEEIRKIHNNKIKLREEITSLTILVDLLLRLVEGEISDIIGIQKFAEAGRRNRASNWEWVEERRREYIASRMARGDFQE